jgi:hypothetical protein
LFSTSFFANQPTKQKIREKKMERTNQIAFEMEIDNLMLVLNEQIESSKKSSMPIFPVLGNTGASPEARADFFENNASDIMGLFGLHPTLCSDGNFSVIITKQPAKAKKTPPPLPASCRPLADFQPPKFMYVAKCDCCGWPGKDGAEIITAHEDVEANAKAQKMHDRSHAAYAAHIQCKASVHTTSISSEENRGGR